MKVDELEQKNEKILLSIPANDAKAIAALVASGRYATKTEVVRTALKNLLYRSYEPPKWDDAEMERRTKNFLNFAKEVQAKIKEKGYTRKDLDRFLKEAKEETRKEVRRMLAELKSKGK